MLDKFTLETFQPLLGSSFAISGGSAGTGAELDDALVLIEADSLGFSDGDRDPFTLLFLRRSQAVLLDETYTLEHSSLGSFDLFIVPVAQDAEGVRYEAIFN